jgi:predicted nucleic acid-binding Zn finger protein
METSFNEHIILEQILRDIRVSKEISLWNWQRLRNTFGDRFDKAWKLVTERRIKKYIFRPSMKTIWIAIGQNAEYLIYSNADYCSCSDFYFRVLDHEKAYCYHLLAQKIAEALNNYDVVEEEDEIYPVLLNIWKAYSVSE